MGEEGLRVKELISGVTVMSFKLRLIAVLFFYCLTATVNAQGAVITFEVVDLSRRDGEVVHITGNHPQLGMWNPSAIPMNSEDGKWSISKIFPAGAALEFKFTRGSWDREALTDDGRVPQNHVHYVEGDTILRFIITSWRESLYAATPRINGEYRIHEDFPVPGLKSRRVIVWMPPSYATELTRSYPVLYLHDGQNVFDPGTSAFGHDWRVDEIADSLIRIDVIEEFIAVAVYNDPDVRMREYSNDPVEGKLYQEYMVHQLKPWIDSMYRSKPGREHTAVMGASMGGLISFILAWEYPDVFGMAACLSPAFKVVMDAVKIDYVSVVSSSEDIRDINLYIDNGTLDLEALLQPGIDDMLDALDAKGLFYTWYLDDGAPHNEHAWSSRVWRPLV